MRPLSSPTSTKSPTPTSPPPQSSPNSPTSPTSAFGSRTSRFGPTVLANQITPGVGHYDLPSKDSFILSTPSLSKKGYMGGFASKTPKFKREYPKQVPGPGRYNIKDSLGETTDPSPSPSHFFVEKYSSSLSQPPIHLKIGEDSSNTIVSSRNSTRKPFPNPLDTPGLGAYTLPPPSGVDFCAPFPPSLTSPSSPPRSPRASSPPKRLTASTETQSNLSISLSHSDPPISSSNSPSTSPSRFNPNAPYGIVHNHFSLPSSTFHSTSIRGGFITSGRSDALPASQYKPFPRASSSGTYGKSSLENSKKSWNGFYNEESELDDKNLWKEAFYENKRPLSVDTTNYYSVKHPISFSPPPNPSSPSNSPKKGSGVSWSKGANTHRFDYVGKDNKVPGPQQYFQHIPSSFSSSPTPSSPPSPSNSLRSSGVYSGIRFAGKMNQAPKYVNTFGGEAKRFDKNFLVSTSDSPGPGSYNVGNNFAK